MEELVNNEISRIQNDPQYAFLTVLANNPEATVEKMRSAGLDVFDEGRAQVAIQVLCQKGQQQELSEILSDVPFLPERAPEWYPEVFNRLRV